MKLNEREREILIEVLYRAGYVPGIGRSEIRELLDRVRREPYHA